VGGIIWCLVTEVFSWFGDELAPAYITDHFPAYITFFALKDFSLAGILGGGRIWENSGELLYISANIQLFLIFEHSYILYS